MSWRRGDSSASSTVAVRGNPPASAARRGDRLRPGRFLSDKRQRSALQRDHAQRIRDAVMAIVTREEARSGSCQLTQAQIASECGISASAAKRAVGYLRSHKMLVRASPTAPGLCIGGSHDG